jgi:FkbM family methyltransferase
LRTREIVKTEAGLFEIRPDSSDMKTVEEVVNRGSYETKLFKIERGEKWLDLGGNVGAFTVLAASRGAAVTVLEPDPENVCQISRNLELNKLEASIIQACVVSGTADKIALNLWPDGQSWRNSAVRNKKGTRQIIVKAINFDELLNQTNPECIKMDIEGSEISILMNWAVKRPLKKLVFEWSFDASPEVEKLRFAISKLRKSFKNIKHTSQINKVEMWKYFPPCTTVFCWN